MAKHEYGVSYQKVDDKGIALTVKQIAEKVETADREIVQFLLIGGDQFVGAVWRKPCEVVVSQPAPTPTGPPVLVNSKKKPKKGKK